MATNRERLEALLYEMRVREPTVARVLGSTDREAPIWPEQRFLRAYDELVNYAKALLLGDDCKNPLDSPAGE